MKIYYIIRNKIEKIKIFKNPNKKLFKIFFFMFFVFFQVTSEQRNNGGGVECITSPRPVPTAVMAEGQKMISV
jgi:hypothetical protein